MSAEPVNRVSAAATAPSGDVQMSFAQALDVVKRLLSAHKLDTAEELLGKLAGAVPGEPHVAHLNGMLLHLRGDHEGAAELLERVTKLLPRDVDVWNDLGNVHVALDRQAQAESAYEQAITLAGDTPRAASPLYNLAQLRREGGLAGAEKLLRRAVALAPDSAPAWYGLSRVLIGMQRFEEGFDAGCRGVLLAPGDASRDLIGRALVHAGQRERAIEHYRTWQEQEPDNPVARHHLAALQNPTTEVGASRAYVETVFDSFAASFEKKLESLEYRVPALIKDVVATFHPHPAGRLSVLDAGCGTGLCGPLLRPYAQRLVGVDLSQAMLDLARRKECFDELRKDDLVEFMRVRTGEFDLIVCADTLCYFAGLDQVLEAAKGALRSGGQIVFTVEAIDDDSTAHELRHSGRYAHSLGYLAGVLPRAGLRVQAAMRVTLRTEAMRPVMGWLVSAEIPVTA